MSSAMSFMAEAAFSFVGTVESAAADTMPDLSDGDRWAVVRVDRILQVPDAFTQLAGTRLYLRLAEDADVPTPGETFTFFANGLAFGVDVSLIEVARLPEEELSAQLAMAPAVVGEDPLDALQRQLAATLVRDHASTADAVILARVVGLERAGASPVREHDPDWWRATMHVTHAERGEVADDEEVRILYANSLDIQWRDAPKPKAAQNGLWLLHATEPELKSLAPFKIIHAEDLQPPQNIERLRQEGDQAQ
ncbi:hypothetical protein [Arthrobacter sp. NPDC058192]|uniref:hypothetical protein n=1 Tax=Arthrobacter sp. NPDC058192 TaxID=3346372 RepID=UPI0036ECA245